MTADLYQMLGVGKKASRKQIREAYRQKAKATHPDTGGSAETFALVKRAHDVLTDDERRAKYDSNGDTSEPKRDDSLRMAINIIGIVLDRVLTKIDRKNADPVAFDIVADMKVMLGGDIDTLSNHVTVAKRNLVKAEKMLGRFRVKKGENFLDDIMRQKVEAARGNVKILEEQLTTGKKAMDMLREFSFACDAGASGAYGAPSFNMNGFMAQAMGSRF